MDFVKEFTAGWFGGVAGMLVGHPFDTVKSRLQTQGSGGREMRYNGTFHCFKDIVKTEGSRGLYKGLASPLLGMAAINAIIFSVHGSCIRVLQPEGGDNTIINTMLAGAMAGTVQCTVCIPIELIKVRMQLQNIGQETSAHRVFNLSKQSTSTKATPEYRGPLYTAAKILRNEGIGGLYKGSVVTVWREAPAFATYFATYDWLRQVQVRKGGSLDDLSPMSLIMAGGVSGVLAWVVTYPFDVIKSRIQSDGMAEGSAMQYKGMIDCFRKSCQQDGVSVLFRGLNATLLRAFPVNAATFLTVTLMLRKWKPDERHEASQSY